MLTGEPRGVEIVAQRRANAVDLVSRNLLALSAAADDNAAVGFGAGHQASHLGADRRIVDRRLAVGAAVVDLMAEPFEQSDDVLLQQKAGVVGADGDSHGRGLYGMPTVTISRRGEERVRAGHPWVYRSDVTKVDAAAGDIVEVIGSRARSDRVGVLQRSIGDRHPDGCVTSRRKWATSFWRDRLANAIRYRDELAIDATAFRLVHGEADRLPSLIVDRYGDYLVVQALSQAVDRHLTDITSALVEVAKPAGILARNDPRVRLLEGLDQRVDVLYGTVPDDDRRPRRGRALSDRSVARAEERVSSSTSGKIAPPRHTTPAAGCSTRSATTVDSRSRSPPTCESVLAVDISEEAVAADS